MADLPEGLHLIDSVANDEYREYEFYQDPEDPRFSPRATFLVRTDGCVEIHATIEVPGVPVNVLRFIADEADRLRKGA